MRFWVFVAALLIALPLAAQETPVKKKPAAKKPAAAKKTPHRKPTPEQIRKFNELEKKQKQ
jgi:hypothetical protein